MPKKQDATRDTQDEDKPIFIGYRKLIAWQKADILAHVIYDLSIDFPKEEIFGVTSQLRRAVISIGLNIVEGYARNSKKEFHHFLSFALGSIAEVEYLLEFSYKRGYLSKESYNSVLQLRNEVGQLVWRLYLSQE